MKRFIVFAIFVATVLMAIISCATIPSAEQIEAQEVARAEAEKQRSDSLEQEIKIALSLGLEYYKNSQYVDAIPHFKRIINDLNPEENRAWKYLADSYFRMDQPDSAFAVYKEGISKFPEIGYLHRGIATLFQRKASENHEYLDSAITEYAMAYKLDSTESYSATQIGLILLSRGMLDSSVVWFNYSVKADADQIDTWLKLADLYLVRGNWVGVREAYQNLTRIDPSNTEYILNLGRAQANTGEYENAVATLDAYIEANPEDSKGYQYMGLVHTAKGKYDLAQQAFREAEKLAPNNIKLLLDIADTYVDMNSYSSANQYLRKARSCDPKSCQAIIIEGNICVGKARADVPPEGLGIKEKLRFECCYEIYKNAICADCERVADIARMKLRYLEQFMPTPQEKKEFFFIHPELDGKICD
ncbi:tetratricopeptide repeat protein [bacterium]|nr:tetratricopeptide repeat protein [bacterium]